MNTLIRIRQHAIEDFNETFPKSKPTPHYSKVKKMKPDLYEFIMLKFNGYRAFLRVAKRKMPPTSAKERAFIKYSGNVSRRYFINCWSSLEEWTFGVLTLLDEENNFIHNFPFPSPKGFYYKLDFYDPFRRIDLEVDGIFHTAIPDQNKRDCIRDEWLKSFDIRVLRLTSEDFHDLRIITRKITNLLGD